VGFHGVYLVALQTAKLGSACAVGHCHQEFIALRAAVVIHGSSPAWRKSRRENIIWVSEFNRKSTGSIGLATIGARSVDATSLHSKPSHPPRSGRFCDRAGTICIVGVHSCSAFCAGSSVSSPVNPETDTPSSLTAFFIGKSALNNSIATFANLSRCTTEPATVSGTSCTSVDDYHMGLPRVGLDNINQPDDRRLKPARLP
jgi:hypothetical protein